MHCNIFELSNSPVPEEEQYSEVDIPDQFFGSIADHATDVTEEDREDAIEYFVECLGAGCTFKDGELRFADDVKERYFRSSYANFQASLKALMSIDFEAFSGQRKAYELHSALSQLNQTVEDKFGHYIYYRDTEALIPVDSWMRAADLSRCFYFGGVIDYHW